MSDSCPWTRRSPRGKGTVDLTLGLLWDKEKQKPTEPAPPAAAMRWLKGKGQMAADSNSC